MTVHTKPLPFLPQIRPMQHMLGVFGLEGLPQHNHRERYRAGSVWQRKYYTGREAPTPPRFTALALTGDTSHTVYYSFLFSQTGALALFDVQRFLANTTQLLPESTSTAGVNNFQPHYTQLRFLSYKLNNLRLFPMPQQRRSKISSGSTAKRWVHGGRTALLHPRGGCYEPSSLQRGICRGCGSWHTPPQPGITVLDDSLQALSMCTLQQKRSDKSLQGDILETGRQHSRMLPGAS